MEAGNGLANKHEATQHCLGDCVRRFNRLGDGWQQGICICTGHPCGESACKKNSNQADLLVERGQREYERERRQQQRARPQQGNLAAGV
jgi:hypothetical protein